MNIIMTNQVGIPADSLTRQYLPADYVDAFTCDVIGVKKLTADELQIEFWTVMPGWVNSLMKLRNVLVRPFGLQTGKTEKRTEEFRKVILNGGQVGLISVTAKSDNETVLLLSDSHLNAYMSVIVAQNGDLQTITVVTVVQYHNTLGRIYFFFVKPFHKIIVKATLKGTLNRILK